MRFRVTDRVVSLRYVPSNRSIASDVFIGCDSQGSRHSSTLPLSLRPRSVSHCSPTLSSCCCSLCSRTSRLSSRIRCRTIHGLSLRDVDRNGGAHFCPCTCPAPNSKFRADVLCALTHSAKTPVRIALSLNGSGINSAAIVTNEHAQEVVLVLNFNLDLCRLGVTQRVDDRFSADQKELLLDCRVQCPRLSLDEDAKPQTPPSRDFA